MEIMQNYLLHLLLQLTLKKRDYTLITYREFGKQDLVKSNDFYLTIKKIRLSETSCLRFNFFIFFINDF